MSDHTEDHGFIIICFLIQTSPVLWQSVTDMESCWFVSPLWRLYIFFSKLSSQCGSWCWGGIIICPSQWIFFCFQYQHWLKGYEHLFLQVRFLTELQSAAPRTEPCRSRVGLWAGGSSLTWYEVTVYLPFWVHAVLTRLKQEGQRVNSLHHCMS